MGSLLSVGAYSFSPPRCRERKGRKGRMLCQPDWQLGYKVKADSVFNVFIQYSNMLDKLDRPGHIDRHFFMAQICAFKGEKEKAYAYLEKVYQRQRVDYYLTSNLKDPMFNSLRNEPEFQQIARDIEAKYQAEHERIRRWLEENKML